MKPTYMVFLPKSTSKSGAAKYMRYLVHANPKPDKNDRGLEDRVAGIKWNFDIPFDRDRAFDMGRLIDAECTSPRAHTYKSIVFSCPPVTNPVEHAAGMEKCRQVMDQFLTTFGHGAKAIAVGHAERWKPHVHGLIANRDPQTGRPFNWSDNMILHFMSFDWCTV